MSDEKLEHLDDYKVFDKLENEARKKSNGPLGYVKIFLKTKDGLVFDEGYNLVVAQGREFVAQKISNIIAYNGGSRPDLRSYLISHFSIGKGGSVIGGGGEVILNGPYICDTHLINTIQLGTAGYLTEPSGTTLSVKSITADSGSMLLESQSFTGGGSSCTYYTKIKCTCVIPSGEPTSLLAGESVKVDEAGLYFVSGTTTKMFAHICFAPKWKEKESTLTIVWYILC